MIERMTMLISGMLFGVLLGSYLLRKYGPWNGKSVMVNITIVVLAIAVALIVIKIVVYAVTGERLPF